MAKNNGASLEQAMPKVTKDSSTLESQDPMKDYETKGHLQTLIDAHHIMSDPEKMQRVHALAGAHHKAIRNIQDIKDHYNMKFGAKSKPLGNSMQTLSQGSKDMESTGDGGESGE